MKKILIIMAAASVFTACKSGDKKADVITVTKDTAGKTDQALSADNGNATLAPDTANLTTIEWLDSTYLDLGKQKEGKEIEISFRFKNTGNKALVIQNVTAQCGCTIPEKPEKPFAPGEEGVIKAKFNGSGHDETQKEIYVNANTNPGRHTLKFRAQLVK